MIVPEELAVVILPRIVAAADALEDGDAGYAHTVLLVLELDIEAWREAA
jgi:hypothetical protein